MFTPKFLVRLSTEVFLFVLAPVCRVLVAGLLGDDGSKPSELSLPPPSPLVSNCFIRFEILETLEGELGVLGKFLTAILVLSAPTLPEIWERLDNELPNGGLEGARLLWFTSVLPREVLRATPLPEAGFNFTSLKLRAAVVPAAGLSTPHSSERHRKKKRQKDDSVCRYI